MISGLNLDKSNWELVKLGELAEEISVRVENPSEIGIDKFVGLEDFISGDLKISSYQTTKTLTSSTKQFQAGDILFARRNAYLRRASFVDFDGVCSGDAFVLRENHERLIKGFLAFIVNSERLWDFANSNAAGTMSKRVKWRDLSNYELLIPSKKKQSEIIELLSSLDKVIQNQMVLQKQLDISKKSYEKQALIKYRKGIESKLPIDYAVFSLDELAEITGGSTPSRKNESFWNGSIPWLTPTDVTRHNRIELSSTKENITEKGLKDISNKLYPSGSILFCSRATIGSAVINSVPMATNQGFSNFVCNQKVDPYFLYFLLKYLTPELTQLAGGSTFLEISKSSIRKFKVILPDRTNMMKIKNALLKFETARVDIQEKISFSKSLQKSLINKVF